MSTPRHANARAALAALALVAAWPLVARTDVGATDVADRVKLRDGSLLRGIVVEVAPGDHVTLRDASGALRRFAWAEVASVHTADESPAASRSAAAPPASASAAAAPPASAAPPPSPAPSARLVRVTLRADSPAAALEARARDARAPWRSLCTAPCDVAIDPAATDLRVAGAGVHASNPFRVRGEGGDVRLQASTGSARRRDLGLDLVFAGIPVALGGVATFGIARTENAPSAVATTGIVALVIGGAAALVGLPLLATSATQVRDDDGTVIGAASSPDRY